MSKLAASLHPNLDPSHYPLVALLAWHGPARISDLAEEFSLDKSTISRHVDSLTRLGLVERTHDPDDARARLVTLTPAGMHAVRQQQRARRKRLYETLSTWDADEIVELTRLLGKLSESQSHSAQVNEKDK